MGQQPKHPLAAIRAQRGWSATQYLARVDQIHREMGFGAMAVRREKVARWESGAVCPELSAQLAMANLECIPADDVNRLGWPFWLIAALRDTSTFQEEWNTATTRAALQSASEGGSVDRRAFLLATGASLSSLAAGWANSIRPDQRVRRIGGGMTATIDAQLSHLRHLDDLVGGGRVRPLATEQLRFITGLLTGSSYDLATEQRLYSAAAEASRICGWTSYDAGHHAAAQRYFAASLRASSAAGDVLTGANTLSFMAIQTYSVGDPRDAVDLLDSARQSTKSIPTPRVRAIMAARTARALSKLGDGNGCRRALDDAFSKLCGPYGDDDPEWSYWVTDGELRMLAGSCALDLGDPAAALDHFRVGLKEAGYSADEFPRGAGIYLARAGDAHLLLGEVEAAVGEYRQALACFTDVTSDRGNSTVSGIASKLVSHSQVPAASELLDRIRGEFTA